MTGFSLQLLPSLLGYRPFLDPLAVWDYWVFLLLPLSLAISIVYKSVRTDSMRRVPAEAARLTIWIVTAMGAAAIGLMILVRLFTY
jgi:hypothetical protein